MKSIFVLAAIFISQIAVAGTGKLQNEDFKTLTQITNAGGTAANLLNDTKVYVTGPAKQLSAAINDGSLFSASSPLTTKGDIISYSTAPGRVPVGSNNQVVTADSTQTFGWKWAAVPAGGLSFSSITADTTLAVGTAYNVNKAGSAAVLTLPSACAPNDRIQIHGAGTQGWSVYSSGSTANNFFNDATGKSYLTGTSVPIFQSTGGHSAIELACTSTNTDWSIIDYNGGQFTPNYYGTGADGDVEISVNTSLTVPNTSGSFNGDAVVKNYHNLTVDSGFTLTTSQPGRGMLLYVSGNLVVNGTISMQSRGAFSNPTSDGAGSSLIIKRIKTGSSATNTSTNLVAGMGATAVAAENNQPNINGAGLVINIPCVGGSGGASGTVGGTISSGSGGGGGGGPFNAVGGAGAAGTCFSGGSAGGGSGTTATPGGAGAAFGGAGGNGAAGGTAGGNAPGNPCGTGGSGSCTNGDGGLLMIFVKGNVTIGASGVITAQGNIGGNSTSGGGGGSGGGIIILLYSGTFSNAGSITAAGGAAGPGNGSGAGAGGAGTVITSQID